jgi:4-hydroxy-tetrahydrodipicolinate synthase
MTQRGIGPHLAALVVPFTAQDTVDEAALRGLIRYVAGTRIMNGVVVNAHAGEVASLTLDERRVVIEVAVEEAHRHGLQVVAGIDPHPDTHLGAIRMGKEIEAAGADAILLMAPKWFSWGITPEVVHGYVKALADHVQTPLLFFTMGAYSGVHYTPEMVRRVADVPRVIGVKDTMWSTDGFEANLRVLREVPRPFTVLTGNDTHLFYNFLAGADGTLLILNVLYPEIVVEMFDGVRAGDIQRARNAHQRQEELARLLFAPPMLKMVPRMKEALVLLGRLPRADVRPPLPRLGPQERAALRQAIIRAKLLDA